MVAAHPKTLFSCILIVAATLAFSTSALAQDDAAAGEGAPPADTIAPPPAEEAPPAAPAATASAADSGERQSKNSVYLEGLGHGLLYSINYDRLVIDELAVRLGFSYLSIGASATSSDGSETSASVTTLFFPITASYVGLYSGSHGLEVGGGGTLMYVSGAGSGFGVSSEASGVAGFGTVHVGYRLQPVDYGFQFRVGLMGLIGPGLGFDVSDPSAVGFLPWGYLSLGGSF